MPASKKRPRKIFMPGDYGDRKTRQMYRRSGPVVSYKSTEVLDKMPDLVLFDELLKMPVDQARDLMLEMSKTYSDQKLAEMWVKQPAQIRKLRGILGINKNHSGTVINLVDIQNEKWPPLFHLSARGKNKKAVDLPPRHNRKSSGKPEKVEMVMETVPGTFTCVLKRELNGEELSSWFEAIKQLLDASVEKHYSVALQLTEISCAAKSSESDSRICSNQ
jgi:hypothetical protein